MSKITAMPPYPWQHALWERFVGWIEKKRLAHALLIAGPEGLGGFSLARAMGNYLLCDAPTGAIACGKCRSCQLLTSDSHPDLLNLQPEAPSTAIKIDQVRQVTEFLSKTAQQNGRKIVLLSPAEAMNHNAANALLKSLEEPAGQAHLILVSYQPSRLLATIRSRCAKLPLTVPPTQESLAWLEKIGVAENTAQLLAQAGGEPLKVQRWFEQDFPAQQGRMRKDLEALANGTRSPLDVGKAWSEFNSLEVMDSLLVWIFLAIRQRRMSAQASASSTDALTRLLVDVPEGLLFRYWDKLAQSKQQLLSRNNPNVELVLDELLMGWSAMCRHG